MTTAKYPPNARRVVSEFLSRIATRAEMKALDDIAATLVTMRPVLSGERINTAAVLRCGAGILDALADYYQEDDADEDVPAGIVDMPPGSAEVVAPTIAVGVSIPTPTVSVSASVVASTIAVRASIPTPTVSVIPNTPKFSRGEQRATIQIVMFLLVWLTLTSRALEDFQQADTLITASGLNPWIAACSAWWCAGKAFNQLYPPADGK